nr:hypothetical protein [uncultured Cohaesibacter sp.]
MTDIKNKILAFIDEGGAKGLSRNLTDARDDELGLLCSISVPEERLHEMRPKFQRGFDEFLKATPPNSQPHISKAFASNNQHWKNVAHAVRSEFFGLIGSLEIPIVFEARRARVQRSTFEKKLEMRENAQATARSEYKVKPKKDRTRIETELMVGLALKLDALCHDTDYRVIDMFFDETDLLNEYKASIKRVQNIGKPSTKTVTGYNPKTKSTLKRQFTFQMSAPDLEFPMDAQNLGEISILGKLEPLILAVDMVANSLYRHLVKLEPNEQLNAPSSIEGWQLAHRVYGAMPNGPQEFI